MSEVTIRWTQRVAGHDVGDVTTVERTPFITAVIAAGRAEVLSETVPAPPAVEAPEASSAPRPVRMKPSMLAALNNPEVSGGEPTPSE